MVLVREIDRWFIDEVLIHADAYHRQARRWAIDADSARDIVQEAYARVIATPRWRELPSPKAYVMTTVRNIAIDRLRQARVVPFGRGAGADVHDLRDEQPSAFDQLAARQELAQVLDVLNTLSSQQLRVVEMRKFEDCSPREIAARLKISVSTVETHLVRGLTALMEVLERGRDEADNGQEPCDHKRRRPQEGSGRVARPARRRNG